MSNADDEERKRELECERLASDFLQLSYATLHPDLKAHCIRMANYWADQAVGKPKADSLSLDKKDEHDA